ncbi:ATPase family AAA domain-containing protein 1-B [Trichonephila clavata]|uniref:ATPase family AAA domain-containing protein 1-B n=1 Tax=Trichonephila clavata TaxID=2740835 RepID=A0A8X6H6D6_TRICU|nr:ATPase family AAA domain-containing protein 1-B [Trichonephila clavata]
MKLSSTSNLRCMATSKWYLWLHWFRDASFWIEIKHRFFDVAFTPVFTDVLMHRSALINSIKHNCVCKEKNPKQRCGVLKLVLENEVISEDVNIEEIAKRTDSFSGSDLRELCRNAALYRVRDYCNAELKNKSETESSPDAEVFHDALRPISMEDFVNALSRMKDSKVHTSIKFRSRVPDLD